MARLNFFLPAPPPVADLGLNANLNGKVIFAAGTEWKRDISGLSADANSATQLSSNAGNFKLEGLGWSSGGATQGLPYYVVDSQTQPMVPVCCGGYPTESMLCYAPIPALDTIIESYPNLPTYPAAPFGDDNHVLIVDRYLWVSYELNGAYRRSGATGADWYCRSMTVFDLDKGDGQHPAGWTSGDVAGCSILQGLLRGEELINDTINHAIRTTVNINPGQFTLPATHGAYNVNDTTRIPLGGRIRLRSNYPETGNFPSTSTPITAEHVKIIKAMKKYGIMNTDANGAGPSTWSQGDTSPIHSDYATYWAPLANIGTADYTVVASPNSTYLYESGIPTGSNPTTALTASSSEITVGASTTLTPTVSGAVIQALHGFGLMKTIVPRSVSPIVDTWYTLQALAALKASTGDPGGSYAHKRIMVTNGSKRETTYDFYVSPAGAGSQNGTIGNSFAWATLFSGSYTHLIAGAVIGCLDGTYDFSGLTPAGNDVPFYVIPGGVVGKPTVIQAVNSRLAIFSTGSKNAPAMGRSYGYVSHIKLNSLKFTTTGADYGVYFFGQNDTGLCLHDCEFSGQLTCGARIGGGFTYSHYDPLVRSCLGPAGKPLVRLSNSSGMLLRSNTAGATGGTIWEDYGSNTGTVVD